ncbi:glycosyl transferase family 1, partial [Hydrocoleum sp. CS-953]|uniref:glycosyltransferase n=1 Tax=Hydrocoleum sp. CS-953 TaxID=1671698 RepID=UPI000BC93572
MTGKPLIYASLGTLVNSQVDVFDKIATACEGLDAQLVISLGGSATPESLPNLPGNPLVVKYAPQLELLQKATLTITHAGMNTTLECLNNAVPMVA